MARLSKRMQSIRLKTEGAKVYSIQEAIALLKQCANQELFPVRFKETVEVSVNLGIDPRKSDQAVRSSSVLPHGTGKTPRVAVFAQGDLARLAQEAGADLVGFEDLADTIRRGEIQFDVLIATPDAMRLVGQLGQILGPKGLMPNPKVGTVTADVATAVSHAKSGQVRYRAEKGGIIHCPIGKIDFQDLALIENLRVLLNDLKRIKPASAKGLYIRKVTLSSTMGPGLSIEQSSIWDLA